jgi:FkbM family methyltransferase
MFSILDLISGERPVVNIVDVGAMSLGEDHFQKLLESGIAKVVGFEPVQSECNKLNAMHRPNHLYLPYFIGDGTIRTFNQCNYVMTSSLYQPYTELLEKFQTLAEVSTVVDSKTLSTLRLDDIQEVADTDYLKVDVQGAELEVFKGAEKVLEGTVVVHTEVEFAPMYLD